MDADDAVLVVLMNNPRDMEIVRKEHWYRIPAKHAPAHLIQARYLAFYFTRAFKESKWTICEYAPVRGHELALRRDLFPDESEHVRADDAYYKLQLGPMIALPRPIVCRSGRRVLFIWTSGEKFSRAVELNDLLGKSDADDALWEALKDSHIGAERQTTVRDARARYRVDYWIRCKRGDLAIILADTPRRLPKGKTWRGLQLTEKNVYSQRGEWVREIQRMIRELGGAKYSSKVE